MGRIDIRVPDEEIAEWKQRAIEEERTLSGWVRERCKGGRAEDHRAQDVRGARKVSTPKRSSGVSERIPAPAPRVDIDATSPKDTARGKVSLPTMQVPHCEHGTAKGYHCWQCGGLAKVRKEAET